MKHGNRELESQGPTLGIGYYHIVNYMTVGYLRIVMLLVYRNHGTELSYRNDVIILS